VTPTPPAAVGAVGIDAPKPRAGETIFASGRVPVAGLPACLVLVPNAIWTIGTPFGGTPVLSAPLPGSSSPAFTHVPLGTAPAKGAYDVLLLDGSCGVGPQTILAASDAGADPALDLSASDIPAVGVAGRIALAALLALAALPLLRRLR
jgi:hypothetical protein